MAMSDDQIALLRLLLAGDTYRGVAEVLGTSADEVKQRAHHAAAALEVEPMEEFSRAAVNERLAALDGAPATGTSAEMPASAAGAARPLLRWALWLAGGAAVVILIVVGVVVASGGGEGDEGSSAPTPDREDIVPVEMSPVGGSHGSGTIAIVRVGDQPAVDFAIRGLQPSGPGETYVLWFVGSGDRSLPVAFQGVGRDGRLTGRAPIPTAASSLLPSFETADLTLARQRKASAAVRRAGRTGTLPQPVGTPVLRGALR
jgi:hypothetical protein